MASPMVPPMRKVGSDGLKVTAAPETDDWVQSSTAPLLTEVLFNCNTKLVPITLRASTPWS